MNRVNLIPASRRVQASRRARVTMWAWACGVGAVCVVVGAGTFRLVRSVDPAGLQSQIDEAVARSAGAESELTRLGAVATERVRALEAASIVGVHPDWSVLLRAINDVRGESVALELVELSTSLPPPAAPAAAPAPGTTPAPPPRAVERYVLKIKGIAAGVQDVTTFVTSLERLGTMERVSLKGTTPQAVRGVTVSGFEIECTLSERSAARAEATP